MPALEADADGKTFLLRFLRSRKYLSHTGGVGGHGFLHKSVLASLHSGLEVNWTETRRRGKNDQVWTGVDCFLIGIEPNESAVLGHLDAAFIILSPCQVSVGAVQSILEQISH